MPSRLAPPVPRPTTAERGYGPDHEAERKRWEPIVADGGGWCREDICLMPGGRWIKPGTPWDLAHTGDRRGYKGPAHAKCNRADGGRRSGGKRRKRGRPRPAQLATPIYPTSRKW